MTSSPPTSPALSFTFPSRTRSAGPKLQLRLPPASSSAVAYTGCNSSDGDDDEQRDLLQSISSAYLQMGAALPTATTPRTASSFTTAPALSPPPPFPPSAAAPVTLVGLEAPPALGLAARRQMSKRNKPLSLIVPPLPASSSSLQPPSPLLSSRSLPPSPSLPLSPNPRAPLTAFIGVEGETDEDRDRTIGRLMRREKEEMREQMRGGRGMKRRKSIPGGLEIGKAARVSGSAGPGVLKMVGKTGEGDGQDEDFPYALGPREILKGVWLGSEENARDPDVLSRWGIDWVLNVAKEVECPWVSEIIDEEDESDDMEVDTPQVDSRSAPAKEDKRRRPAAHRRTKTQAYVTAPASTGTNASRLLFVRPTASTPNLLSAFQSSSSPSPIPSVLKAPTPTMDVNKLTSVRPPAATVHFPRNPRTARPALDYLHLKWGHDEADLVEAGKFQCAFDFLDAARAANGRVLVHCQCGISRSATVVIAYAMREAARDLEEGCESELKGLLGMHDTYSFVKEKSEWVGPNLGLVFQLVAYERTLRGPGRSPTSEAPPSFPDSPDAAASPKTPVSSVGESSGSSDSRLSTPEFLDPPLPPLFRTESSNTTPTLTIFTNLGPKLGPDPHGVESLSPMVAEVLQLDDNESANPTSPLSRVDSPGVFHLPPPRPRANFSHYPTDVTDPPPSPFLEVASPLPTSISFPPPSRRRHSRKVSNGAAGRFAFPSPPKATLLTSTPTAAAVSVPGRPPAAQFSLMRGAGGSSGWSSLSVTEDGEAVTWQASPVGFHRLPFGGQQTPSQRRASHRRVFSVPSI